MWQLGQLEEYKDVILTRDLPAWLWGEMWQVLVLWLKEPGSVHGNASGWLHQFQVQLLLLSFIIPVSGMFLFCALFFFHCAFFLCNPRAAGSSVQHVHPNEMQQNVTEHIFFYV